MTEPLSDEYLALCSVRAESPDLNGVESRDMLCSLLAEVDRLKAELVESTSTVANLRSELDAATTTIQRFQANASRNENEICQELGRALGYPRYCDDQKNFPGATEANGVCVGEHVAVSLAAEATKRIGSLEAEVANLRRELNAATAALEAQGQAAFVAGLRKPDLDALASEIAEFAQGFYSDHYGDKPASVQRAREIYWDRPNGMSFTEGQIMAVRTVMREKIGKALGGES